MIFTDLLMMLAYSGILLGIAMLAEPRLKSWLRGVLFLSDTMLCILLSVELFGSEPRVAGVSAAALTAGIIPVLFSLAVSFVVPRGKMENTFGPTVSKKVFSLNTVLLILFLLLFGSGLFLAFIRTVA